MARPELDRDRSGSDSSIRRPIALGELVLGRDGHATGQGERAIRLDDPERDEEAGDGRAVVDPAERVGDPLERLRLMRPAASLTRVPSMNRVTR